MANLTLELNINSASDLENVNHITNMNVYAVITLRGDKTLKKHKVKTAVHRSGGSNPNWDHVVKFSVNERLALEGRLTLIVRLFSKRLLGDKDVGGVEVPLHDLLRSHPPSTNDNGNGYGMTFMTYQVRTPAKTIKDYLTLLYRFNGAPVISSHSNNQAPTWAQPNQQGHKPYGYMQPPPHEYVYEGPMPHQPTKNEARLQNGDTFVSAMSLIS